MKKEIAISLVLVGLIASMAVGAVSAYDANNPWSGTVTWAIGNDTSFSVSFAGAETAVNFSSVSQNVTNLEPTGQDAGTSTPIMTVTNDGNVNLTFSCNLTAAEPTYATIKVSNATDPAGATGFSTTLTDFATQIQAADSTDMYLWTNITNGVPGTDSRTIEIHSAIT